MNARQFLNPVDADSAQLARWLRWAMFGVALLGFGLASAFAQSVTPPSQILANTAESFRSALSGVEATMLNVARGLFVVLVGIEVAWTGAKYVLDRDNPASVLKDLVALLVQRGLVSILVFKAPEIMRMITGSFTQLGQMAAPGVNITNASQIADIGLDAFSAMWGKLKLLSLITDTSVALTSVITGTILLIAFAVAALQMMMTQIEFYIIASGAVFMVGFFGSRITKQFSEKYISFAIGSGIKMFVCYLVVGASMPLVNQVTTLSQVADPTGRQLGTILISSIVVGFLTWSIPGLAASIASGSVNTSAAGIAGVAGSLVTGGVAAAGAGLAATRFGVQQAGGMGSALAGGVKLGMASSAAGGSPARAWGGAIGSAIGATGSSIGGGVGRFMSGGGDAVADTVGGRAGASLSGQAEQIRAAAGSASAPPVPAPSSNTTTSSAAAGGAAAPAATSATSGVEGATPMASAADAGSASSATASSSPASGPSATVERGNNSAAAPRVAAPPVPGQGQFSQMVGHAMDAGSAMAPPAEASASVNGGFSMPDH